MHRRSGIVPCGESSLLFREQRQPGLSALLIALCWGLLWPLAAAGADAGTEDRMAGTNSGATGPTRSHRDDGRPGWTPALYIGFDLHAIKVSRSFQSDEIPILTGGFGSYQIDDERTITPPMLTIGTKLFAPPITEDFGRPRLFIDLRGQVPASPKHIIARDAERITGDTTQRNRESVRLDVSYGGTWLAGVGVDFDLPLGERIVSIRPSIAYLGASLRQRTDVLIEEQPDPSGLLNPYTPVFRSFDSEVTVLHGLAPGLAVDTVLGRKAGVGIGLYAHFTPIILLSDTSSSKRLPNEVGAGSGTTTYAVDSVSIQAGVGLRLYWVGRTR